MNSAPSELWILANCRDTDLDLDDFYPGRSSGDYVESASRAKAVCRGSSSVPACPVLIECLAFALLTEDNFGIWGGMSPRERNALRRSRDLRTYRSAAMMPDSPYKMMIQTYLEGLPDGQCEDSQGPGSEEHFEDLEE